jgi:hypothetical protein
VEVNLNRDESGSTHKGTARSQTLAVGNSQVNHQGSGSCMVQERSF